MSKLRKSQSPCIVRSCIEVLEQRQLLTTVTGENVVNIDWNGQKIEAVEGEWIVNFQRPAPTVNRFGDVKLNDVFTTEGQLPNAKTRPVVDALAAIGVTFDHYLGVDYSFLVKTTGSLGVKALQNVLTAFPGFVSVEPNAVGHLTATTPSDPNFSNQYALNNTGQVYGYLGSTPLSGTSDADIDAPEAWDYTTGSSSVAIAVLDSGINYTHQDLAANMWQKPSGISGGGLYGADFVNTDSNPVDDNGHGTEVAGVIAADSNSYGGTGVSWNSKLIAVKVSNASGSLNAADVNEGINYVVSLRSQGVNVRVINASFGFFGVPSGMSTAIQAAGDAGILFVTAAGNNGPNNGTQPGGWNNDTSGQAIYPSSFSHSNIISVAATTDDDALATFSNYGATSVDLGAPGNGIFTTSLTGTPPYTYQDGTSFSAPFVAGVAALAFSMKPDLTNDQVKSAIVSQGNAKSSLSGKTYSGKRLNAFNTLSYIQNTFSGYSKTYIGDAGGNPVGDDILLEVSGSNTLIKRYQSGSYQTLATVTNTSTKAIGIFTLAGNDAVTVGAGVLNRLYVSGGMGDDTVQGGPSNDTISGDAGNDAILGNAGADSILGGDGNDSINGGDGNDTIKGQGGSDSMRGGNNDDLFDAVDNVADQVLNGDAGTDSAYYDNPEDNSILASIEDPHPV